MFVLLGCRPVKYESDQVANKALLVFGISFFFFFPRGFPPDNGSKPLQKSFGSGQLGPHRPGGAAGIGRGVAEGAAVRAGDRLGCAQDPLPPNSKKMGPVIWVWVKLKPPGDRRF